MKKYLPAVTPEQVGCGLGLLFFLLLFVALPGLLVALLAVSLLLYFCGLVAKWLGVE